MNYKLIMASLFVAANVNAKVTLPKMFSDGMVMQRETTANVWGNAERSATVKVSPSWTKKTYTAKADSNGKWKVAIETPEAGGPYSITFNDGEKTVLNNILIGELWVCSGQSNMEMQMKGFKAQPVEGAITDGLNSRDPQLRLFTVKRNSKFEPVDTVSGQWYEANTGSVREFSATAYYFGRMLRKVLDVPVGLITVAWGGSACEAWMTADWLKAFPDARIPKSPQDIKSKNRTPTVLYNGMMHPLVGMAMRGVIWYQGEDNVNRYKTYGDMLATMIRGWRGEWNIGDFPFYYCQIAPYDYSLINWDYNSALLREQQARVETIVPNTGMAVLMDAGLEYGIHPRKKRQAGERLALLALRNTYNIAGLPEFARYKDVEFKGDTAVISFDKSKEWVYFNNGTTSNLFEIAGENKVFHPAKAWTERNRVYLKSEKVSKPVAVRYAFKNWADGDLFCDGLPVSSFRSDDWEE
ncbi:sialate O-acetylesterase [Prevotella sp. PCHR]|uniref:Sialate O-acetylesterase n=1 Tax=Xylanibacter caecicola TaxID=2736294 RepID=A0ABX2B115_9BACT|nr:sialate O-acetylesterase [Xylanibacter caecicola]NPE24370.1 sialate O-acetylesterase [Xylanibacter caecicola]